MRLLLVLLCQRNATSCGIYVSLVKAWELATLQTRMIEQPRQKNKTKHAQEILRDLDLDPYQAL